MENSTNPQIKVFVESAKAMKAERYFSQDSKENQRDFLYALQEVVGEVAYHLDRLGILEKPAMDAYLEKTNVKVPGFPASAELVLITAIEERIQELWAQERSADS
ncbi:hypothetical protein [Glutamicibacter ardleyensis]|uniref:hypothetical protein n=1 Tax=Glutamicibacter ardleyensis TaxID=225894 RepID=UPI003FD19652